MFSHKACAHDSTPAARRVCRKAMKKDHSLSVYPSALELLVADVQAQAAFKTVPDVKMSAKQRLDAGMRLWELTDEEQATLNPDVATAAVVTLARKNKTSISKLSAASIRTVVGL